MKDFIEIQESKWLPGNKKMIYKDKHGKTFIGPPIEYTIGETSIVEVSEGPMEDGYYHIIKAVGHIQKKKQI